MMIRHLGGVSSKCVSTAARSKNVPLRILCTAFCINVREGLPEYGVKLE